MGSARRLGNADRPPYSLWGLESTIVTCNTINKLFPRYDTTDYLSLLLKIVYCTKWVVFSNSITISHQLRGPGKGSKVKCIHDS